MFVQLELIFQLNITFLVSGAGVVCRKPSYPAVRTMQNMTLLRAHITDVQ